MQFINVEMIRFYLMFILATALASCSGNGAGHHTDQLPVDPVEALPPSKAYSEYLSRLRSSPASDGYIYHKAFYSAVDADSLRHFASFLDSMLSLNASKVNTNYIVSHRLLCSYMLSLPDIDALKDSATSMKPSSDPTQEEVSSHVTAKTMVASDPRRAFDMQFRAVEAMRHGGTYRPAEVLAQAALICTNLGRYQMAMDYINEATDTLIAHGWPKRETIFVLGNKANLYQTLEMIDSALSVNSHALEVAADSPSMLADLLGWRAETFAQAGERDSAYFYIDSALQVVSSLDLSYKAMFARHLRARRGILTVGDSSASNRQISEAVSDIREALSDWLIPWEERFAIALGEFRLGDHEAITRMEEAHDSLARHIDPREQLWIKRALIDAYTATGRTADASREYAATFRLMDTIDTRYARYLSIANDIQYHARERLQENVRLRSLHQRDSARVSWLTIICGMVLLLLGGATWLIIHSHRRHRRSIEAHNGEIDTLRRNNGELSEHIEELKAAGKAREASEEWDKLTPPSMTSEDNARFRHAFNHHLPDFLDRLNSRCEGLTPGDETLCMLIRIGRDTDDISVALGISRASVNSARYRIRRKMNLAKEESLDDLINSL